MLYIDTNEWKLCNVFKYFYYLLIVQCLQLTENFLRNIFSVSLIALVRSMFVLLIRLTEG